MKNKAFKTVIAIAVFSTLILTGCGEENIPEETIPVPGAAEQVEQPIADENAQTENADAPAEEIATADSDNTEEVKEIPEPDNTPDTDGSTVDNNAEEVKKEISEVDNRIADVEVQEQEQYKRLEKEDITQSEMNHIASSIYSIWDDQLNWMWGEMENKLDADTMSTLRTEQNEWLETRNKQMKDAGAIAEGGSMQPLLEASKGAEMTKSRVYELAQWLR